MRIEHIAIWTTQLEELKNFYVNYFGASSGEKYISINQKGFESYFLTFDDNTRIELMYHPDLLQNKNNNEINFTGFAHIAFVLKSKEDVDLLIKKMEKDNIKIISYPRTTGDGYYEACILDLDENKVEITAEKL